MMLLKLILCASCLLFSSHAFAVNYGVLFLDKSTSMNSKRQDGRSRCDVSKDIAKKSVKNFYSSRGFKVAAPQIFCSTIILKRMPPKNLRCCNFDAL